MAQIPKSKQTQVFNKELDGVYGHFKTKQSFALDYILTSIKSDRLNWLETASDVLDIKAINFEEIVQRDIDYVRVQKEIIEEYLQKGKDRVIFFPPLMVTLYGIDGKTPTPKYTTVESEIVDDKFLVTYDKNRFQTELPLTEDQTSHFLEYNGNKHYYYNYAATLRFNSEKVRLVVLDGQHRLTALKKLIENGGGDIVSDIDLPICIFFAPNALATGESNENLSDDMRELFVTINKEAKEVSGHFLWLLKDRSLAAMSVRDLGDAWKQTGGEFSYLHQHEWNQREASKADQAQKAYSITTVSILAEALKSHIFTGRKDFTYSLLNLGEVEQELIKSDSSRVASEINEDSFDLDQADVLKRQIHKYITPSLDILFRKPSPYIVIRKEFENSIKLLEKSVEESIKGASQFKNDVLGKFRSANKLDQDSVQDLEREFTDSLRSKKSLQDVDFFRRNIFHQALIRSWADLYNVMRNVEPLTPVQVAGALVEASEVICFHEKASYFDPYKAYSQRVFYKGEKIIVNDTSKTGLRHLIVGAFASSDVCAVFATALGLNGDKGKVLIEKLRNYGLKSVADYLNIFQNNQIKWLNREWRFADLNEKDQAYLEERFEATDEVKAKEFRDRIELIASKRLIKAKEILANVLKIKLEDIPMTSASRIDTDGTSEI